MIFMINCRIFFTIIILSHVVYAIEKEYRVAYVFAGSARSFITPLLKQTIKINLIESFCPETICSYDIFVRISADDNTHTGIDAAGTFIASNNEVRKKIKSSVNELDPTGTRLYTEFYEIGSREEWKLMEDYASGNVRHKIYRELDTRRYSMYFGRWKAYEMMLRQEKINGWEYNWVVHARLDIGWGTPIYPVTAYNPKMLYAADTWHVEIPDTFSIMSRNTSEIYFGMKELMHPKVFCLGGPNLDTRKLEPENLRKAGYSSYELDIIYQEDCRRKFPEYGVVHAPKLKLNWTTAGYSEYFLKRKFAIKGFTIMNGKVQLRPFYMFLVRYPQSINCFWLEPYHLISWVKVQQSSSAALYPSCLLLSDDIKKYGRIDGNKLCEPKENPRDFTDPNDISCLLRYENTNLNFMPFRIRWIKQCLTFDGRSTVNMPVCINNKRVDRFMEQYAMEQLFYFYPLIDRPQKIMQQTYFKSTTYPKRCLTAILPKSQSSSSQLLQSVDTMDIIQVSYESCQRTSNSKYPSIQMFTIERLILPGIENDLINRDKIYKPNELKPLTGISIRWQYPPSGDIYYLTIVDKEDMYSDNSTQVATTILADYNSNNNILSNVVLKRIQPGNAGKVMAMKGSVFVLERTRPYGTPYRRGISVGNYPTWGEP